jgi:small subunit ribosomal protein S20
LGGRFCRNSIFPESHFSPFNFTVMPNLKSAAKRNRQALQRRDRNRAAKSAIKTQIKKTHAVADKGDAAATTTDFRLSVKKLDQAAAKGIMHRNKAARLKSRLVKHLKATATAKKAAK